MLFKGYFLNCFIGGEKLAPGVAGTWKNQIEMSFAGYDMLIVQHPETLNANPADFRGQALDTTEVTIDIRPSNIEDVVEKLRGLATLLSLITCSQVVLRGWECPGANPSANYWSVIASTGYFRPMLQIRDGEDCQGIS